VSGWAKGGHRRLTFPNSEPFLIAIEGLDGKTAMFLKFTIAVLSIYFIDFHEICRIVGE